MYFYILCQVYRWIFLFSFCNTKISEFFDMATPWVARLCRLASLRTFLSLWYLKSLIYNSVAELRVYSCTMGKENYYINTKLVDLFINQSDEHKSNDLT